MSDLKFEFMRSVVQKRETKKHKSEVTLYMMHSKKYNDYGYVSFNGKKVLSILSKKERIDIGFTKDGSKMAFYPSDDYGYKYRLSEKNLRIKVGSKKLVGFIQKNEGSYNARFTDDGILYIDLDEDNRLQKTIASEEKADAISVKESQKMPVAKKTENRIDDKKEKAEFNKTDDETAGLMQNGSKVFVATFDCLCRQCGQPIKVIMRAGQKGKPVNPNLEYFARSEYGTKTFVTTDGITVRGIPYSRKAKGMQEGYQAHWETCAANNSGRR